MSVTYTPAIAHAQSDAYAGRNVEDPFAYVTYDPSLCVAQFGPYEWMSEILALIASNITDPLYKQTFTCASGLNVGDAVYISGNNAVTLATGTSSSVAKAVGFVRYKPTTTSCLLNAYRYKSGLSGLTAGNPIYLANDGTFSGTAGTYSKVIGTAISMTQALLHAAPALGATVPDGSILTSMIADGNVTLAKLASASVDENKIVSTALASSQGLQGGSGTKLSVNYDNSTIGIIGGKLAVLNTPVVPQVSTVVATHVATMTVTDQNSNTLSGNPYLVNVWISDLAGGADTALTVGSISFTTGTKIRNSNTAGTAVCMLTASGVCAITVSISGSHTVYINAEVGGLISSASMSF